MNKFTKDNFMKPILNSLEALKSGTINKLLAHIKSHDFIIDAYLAGTTISISFTTSVITEGIDIPALFIKGGILRKENPQSPDDVLVVRKYA